MNKTLWCSKRVKRTRARIWIKAQESEGDGDKFELKVTAICIQVDIFHSSTRLSPCPGPVNHFGLSHSTHTHTLIVPTPTSIRLDHSSLLLTLSQFATSSSIFNIQFKFENLSAAFFHWRTIFPGIFTTTVFSLLIHHRTSSKRSHEVITLA